MVREDGVVYGSFERVRQSDLRAYIVREETTISAFGSLDDYYFRMLANISSLDAHRDARCVRWSARARFMCTIEWFNAATSHFGTHLCQTIERRVIGLTAVAN